MSHTSESSRAFQRDLPGGGFVAIEVTSRSTMSRGRVYDGRIIVERRARQRREGHHPPVIAKASGACASEVLEQLFPAAQSNSVIGAALIRR